MHVVHLLPEAVRREHERAGHVFKLRAPAAWQERHDQLAGGQAQRRARLVLGRLERNQVGERMADIGDRHAGGAVKRLLEREHHQDAAHRARDAPHAPAPPSPHRRAHVVDRRDAGVLQLALQAQVEVGRVHADEEIGPLAQHAFGEAAPDAHDLAIVAQGLGVAAHRELLHREVRREALGRHARAADAGELHRGRACFQRRDEVRGQQVPRGFAGHHADAQLFPHRA